ncbi:MAG: UvrD-helicase domain-containing protein [Candidatus Azobacteroides pseudotrichonymphae]|nr:MAG: UvrD-helicase domain-containing protein [Candidatus Azobacteroides pseudotrichonymphae]
MSKIKIYRASAGSGKTYTLVLEYIKCLLISDFSDYFQYILAVSFTKDATNEIKERILSELYGLALNTNDSKRFRSSLQILWEEEGLHWDEKLINMRAKTAFQTIIHNYSRLNITTIDSFFQCIIRSLVRELGYSNHFSLETNTQRVIRESIHNVIEKSSHDNKLIKWLTIYVEHLINEGKNWRIEKSMEIFGECIYNEFFQTKKKYLPNTTLFFSRLIKSQDQIQKDCQTFFKNTVQEIKILLSKHQLNENDFIRKGNPIIFFQKLADGDYPEESKTIEKCCTDKDAWTTKNHKKKEDIAKLAEYKLIPTLNCILEALRKTRTAQMIKDNLYQLGLIGKVIKEIEEQNHEQNRFMLSDTNIFLHQMIDDTDAPFIYEKIGVQIKHVMIDEFQDTSQLQWENFRVLLNEILAQNTFSLIVGDEKQSIYRWRNGDWKIFKRAVKELGTEEKPLLYNWRSEKHIIDFNNSFFPLAANMLKNAVFSIYEVEKVKQKTKKSSEKEGHIFIQFIKDNKEDVQYVDQMMKEAVLEQLKKLYNNGIPAKDICLLVRKKKTINILAAFFLEKRNNYPKMAEKHYLTIVSNEAFSLKSSLAVRIIIASLRIISRQDNEIYYKNQLIYLLKIGGLDVQDLIIDSLLSMPLFELIGYICKQFELEQLPGQAAYLFVFYDYLSQYLKESPATIHHFLEHWEKEGQDKTVPTGMGVEGIKAMTIHKSKGLQFHTVIIPYCDWKFSPEKNPFLWCKSPKNIKDLPFFPITYKKEMKYTDFATEYEEETIRSYVDNLNLLYVAFTRAECNLIILTRYKKKIKEIKRVSDLLQLSVKKLNGNWDEENCHFRMGEIFLLKEEKKVATDNPLKKIPSMKEIKFSPVNFQQEKITFKQSNQFQQLMTGKDMYFTYDNIIHYFLIQINYLEDIEKKVNDGIIQSLIQPNEGRIYIEKIRRSIQLSGVEDWFNSRYKVYRKYSIIAEENGIVINKRPDRFLIAGNKTIIIDYKFETPHSSHEKQLRQYANLLVTRKTSHFNMEMYLWYVEMNQVKKIQLY